MPLDADPSDDLFLDRVHWVGSWNPIQGVPNWVAWRLRPQDLGRVRRTRRYRPDPALPRTVGTMAPTGLLGTGFERGHLCPSGDRTRSRQANASTFLMSNVVAQTHALNSGAWAELEIYVRDWVRAGKHALMVAGPLYPPRPVRVGPGVPVPSSVFKIAALFDSPGPRADGSTPPFLVIAVLMPNGEQAGQADFVRHQVTVDALEDQTGYDFLSALPDELEGVLEAQLDVAPRAPGSEEASAHHRRHRRGRW